MSKPVSKVIVLLSLPIVTICLLCSCAKEKAETQDGVEWLVSYDEAMQVAKKKNQPVMIDFYADWCGWCERLDQDTYSDRDVVTIADRFVPLKLDADVERSLTSQYKIAGLPTILFINPEGNEIHRVVGYRPAGKFLDEMQTALEAFRGGKDS
jgi:thiol:disulfide interchange protein